MGILRCGVLALGVVAGSLVVGAAPALAAKGPPVPAGCSFNQATGVLTCVTGTTKTVSEGPFTTSGNLPATSKFGDFTGLQICSYFYPTTVATTVGLLNVPLKGTVTTTVTSESHGLGGKVFASSTSTSSTLTTITAGEITCIP